MVRLTTNAYRIRAPQAKARRCSVLCVSRRRPSDTRGKRCGQNVYWTHSGGRLPLSANLIHNSGNTICPGISTVCELDNLRSRKQWESVPVESSARLPGLRRRCRLELGFFLPGPFSSPKARLFSGRKTDWPCKVTPSSSSLWKTLHTKTDSLRRNPE